MEEQTRLMDVEENEIDDPLLSVKQQVSKLARQSYPQDWIAYNQAATREKVISEKMLLELLDYFPHKELKLRGRPGIPLKERVYAMFLYSYCGYSSRRTISDLIQAKNRGVISNVPHFNTLLNYFSYQSVTPLLVKLVIMTSLPLKSIEVDFAVDSSGFSTLRFERWFNVRTQKVEKKRQWKKAHLMVGTRTNVITSIEITDGTSADSPELMPLVKNTDKYFDMKEISADKAYLSRENLQGIAELGAVPYIPFKSNSNGRSKGSGIWRQMFYYFSKNRERFDMSYHKRSNVETTFHMIKRKFGNNLKTKKDLSQINEILMKCVCHNLAVLVQESFELGLDINLNSCAKEVLAQKE